MNRREREERDAKVLRMIGAGMSFARIAETFLLDESAVRAIARRHGRVPLYKRPVKGKPPTARQVNETNRAFWASPSILVAYGFALAMATRKITVSTLDTKISEGDVSE